MVLGTNIANAQTVDVQQFNKYNRKYKTGIVRTGVTFGVASGLLMAATNSKGEKMSPAEKRLFTAGGAIMGVVTILSATETVVNFRKAQDYRRKIEPGLILDENGGGVVLKFW